MREEGANVLVVDLTYFLGRVISWAVVDEVEGAVGAVRSLNPGGTYRDVELLPRGGGKVYVRFFLEGVDLR